MAPWCSGYHYWTMQVLRRFKSSSRCAWDSRWWGSLTVVPARNKAKHLLSVNYICHKKVINTNEVLVRDWKPLAWIRLRIPILLTTQHKYIMKMYSNLLQKNFKSKDILYIVKISNKSNNNANNITKISNTSYPLILI